MGALTGRTVAESGFEPELSPVHVLFSFSIDEVKEPRRCKLVSLVNHGGHGTWTINPCHLWLALCYVCVCVCVMKFSDQNRIYGLWSIQIEEREEEGEVMNEREWRQEAITLAGPTVKTFKSSAQRPFLSLTAICHVRTPGMSRRRRFSSIFTSHTLLAVKSKRKISYYFHSKISHFWHLRPCLWRKKLPSISFKFIQRNLRRKCNYEYNIKYPKDQESMVRTTLLLVFHWICMT